MRIAIDARAAETTGGIGRYVTELIRHLPAASSGYDFAAIVYADQPDDWIPHGVEPIRVSRRSKRFLPVLWEHFLLPTTPGVRAVDLLHVPNPTAPQGYRGPLVATVHDLSIYRHPEWFPAGQWLSTRWVVPSTIRRARKLLCVSPAVQEDLIKQFHVPADQAVVIPNGVDQQQFFPSSTGERELSLPAPVKAPYLLFVGSSAPYKNIALLGSIAQHWHGQIVMVGVGEDAFPFGNAPAGIRSKLVLINQLPYGSPELVALYRHAFCLVQPSWYESFALPVLEALACGTPAIVSDIPSLRTVYGDAVGYADPANAASWLQALNALTPETINQRKPIAAELVKQHAWGNIAREVVKVYEAVGAV